MSIVREFFSELTRRGVLRALGAYVAIVWLLAQGLVDLLPAVGLPEWAIRVFLVVAVVATPLIAIIAWRYDLTKKGFLRDRVDVLAARRQAVSDVTVAPTRSSNAATRSSANCVVATWKDKNGSERSQQFFDDFLIGRDFEADIRLNADCVSRQHLKICREGDDWVARDLGSLNGSFIGGSSFHSRKIDGDTDIRLDRSGPVVHLEVASAQATALGTSSRQS